MVIEIMPCPQVRQPENEVGAYRTKVPIEYINADLAPSMPKEILLGSLRDGRIKIKIPIRVKFICENEQVIAEAEEINEFGFGENQSEALTDLQHAIIELYFTLEKEQERLGTDLQRVWDILQKKILKR